MADTNTTTKRDWLSRAQAATRGSRLGAIIACAANGDNTLLPGFRGKACLTSDGYVMCDFVSKNGAYHSDAFVGSVENLWHNVDSLARRLSLSKAETGSLHNLVSGWIAYDYTPAGMRKEMEESIE